jgi:hypothetical protein
MRTLSSAPHARELTGRHGTVTSLRRGAGPTPEENRPIETTSATKPKSSGRRSVRFTGHHDLETTPEPPTRPEPGSAHGAHRAARRRAFPASRDDWLVLAERVVGDWAATLRGALLLVLAVGVGLIGIGVAFGLRPALATAFVALIVFLAGRRRSDSVHR